MDVMIWTFTHRNVNPLALTPDDIKIEDIAHALAQVNRFGGHVKFPITVAQHSCYVAYVVERLNEQYPTAPQASMLQALLHDAAEAYLGDMTKWVKGAPCMQGYREAEERALTTILEKYGCSPYLHPHVQYADRLMVRFEAQAGGMPDLTAPGYGPPSEEELDLMPLWKPWTWEYAEMRFLRDAADLLEARTK